MYDNKYSKLLLNLKRRIKDELNIEIDLSTFKRTHAGYWLKRGGAFSWTVRTVDGEEIGSCETVTSFMRKDTEIIINRDWKDCELILENRK